MSGHCEDCGCRVYSGACTNCHEVVYIEQQYHDMGMDINAYSDEFKRQISDAHDDIYRKQVNKATQ